MVNIIEEAPAGPGVAIAIGQTPDIVTAATRRQAMKEAEQADPNWVPPEARQPMAQQNVAPRAPKKEYRAVQVKGSTWRVEAGSIKMVPHFVVDKVLIGNTDEETANRLVVELNSR